MSAKGNPESGLFIIFDRPNRTEDERASPFSGGASRLFFELIQKAGIPFPSGCYVTYATKCYFPEMAAKELKGVSAETCKKTWLDKEIFKYKPSIVVTVGAEAMTVLTSVTGVMKNRGTFIDAELEGHKFKVMPTFSPSYLMNNHRELEGQVMLDLKRAYNAVHNGVSCWTPGKEKTLDYKYVKDMKMFGEMIKEIKQAGKAACDIESRGKDPYFLQFPEDGFPIVSIQFSTHSGSGWFLLLSHETGSIWTPGEWVRIHKELKWLFESGDIFIIGHNFKFDSKWIMKHLDIKPKLSFDTMLAHGLFGETSSSLKKLAWEMTDIGGYEEEQSKYTESLDSDKKWDMFHYPLEQLSIYGCCDVDATFRVFEILDNKLEDNPQMMSLFKTLVKASRAFLDIEHEGIKIDTTYLKQLDIDLTLEMSKLKADFHQAAFTQIQDFNGNLLKEATSAKTGKLLKNKQIEFNIDSSDHVSTLFYDSLGFPINDKHRSKKTNEPSVGKKALEELAGKHPIAKILMEYRGLSKQKVGFVDAYPRYTDSNNRIHPDYKLIKFYNEDVDKEQGAATGRLACSDPNLQQVPARDEEKRIKRLFIPDCSDHYLMDCDYSGIELRVTAMYCQDPIMKKFFNEGKGDFHRHVASQVHNKPEDQITDLERTYAKSTTFGILYGAGPAKIAEQAKCSIKDAQAFIEEYFRLFPTLKKWILQQKAYAQKNLSVKSLFGRVRSLPDAGSYNEGMREKALRRAVNTPIQSDASDITLYGLTRIASYLNKFPNIDTAHPSRLRASVHDSILISANKDDFEEIAGHVKFEILEKIDLDFITKLGVHLAAEVSIGCNWGQQTKLKTE
jgi:DNA polymerase-1